MDGPSGEEIAIDRTISGLIGAAPLSGDPLSRFSPGILLTQVRRTYFRVFNSLGWGFKAGRNEGKGWRRVPFGSYPGGNRGGGTDRLPFTGRPCETGGGGGTRRPPSDPRGASRGSSFSLTKNF